jgi:autotransporter-associated beta strand protein
MLKIILRILAALALPTFVGAQTAVDPDPNGVLLKPIPDKLIVLTFDDAPASHYTVVAPILEKLGLGGTFYVCDFDSFKTRKDWYLTYRQMIEMDADGLEIGNHTLGHASGYDPIMAMEDQVLAHGGPLMTTLCWPIYAVNWDDCPKLSAHGYTFGRGGHERPYRPTVDNPFDVPSFAVHDGVPVENFIKQAQQACNGRIVCFCFHGVPDMEHPPVSLKPSTFQAMMQYLKDNNYQCVAMRDLTQYIDPVKAAKLPRTADEVKDAPPFLSLKDDHPFIAPAENNIKEFSLPASGTALDFSKPKGYTITTQDESTQTVTAEVLKSDTPNAFTWSKPGDGTWSEATRWSSGAGPKMNGHSDYVMNFDQGGPGKVENDLKAGFRLNQLVFSDRSGGLVLSGNGLTFVKGFGNRLAPTIRPGKCQRVDIDMPLALEDDLTVMTAIDKDPNCFLSFNGIISGPHALILHSSGDANVAGINFHDVHYGILQLNNSNTYSGGTLISGGKINVRKADGLGTGVVTLDHYGSLSSENTLANPLVINNGMLFECSTSGPVTLHGTAHFMANCAISGAMSGAGGLIMHGTNGTYLNMVPGGILTLNGVNSYSGPTIVFPGTLKVTKATGLYHGDAAKWTPKNITIHKAATLRLSVGGPDEFSGEQLGALLTGLTNSVDNNGLMGGSFLALDTANASAPVVVSAHIADSKGPGGGSFLVKKCGPGVMKLAGNNSYTGRTVLEGGGLSISSFNSDTGAKASSSSLGAPQDIEAAEIVIGEEGKDGECSLIYTGGGESTNRVLNFAGKQATVIFEQSGTGLLKFTSDILISGYGADKTIALKGDPAGPGEIAGVIRDPHDRARKAKTSVIKSGQGTWTLSGSNTFSGATQVLEGTLTLSSVKSLGEKTTIEISAGSMLELNFNGELRGGKLIINGKEQPAGTYDAKNAPQFIKGPGVLKI